MTSHHVTCHVTAISRASSLSLKRKEKEIQKKRNIKSRKIDKRKREMLVSKAFHNTSCLKWRFHKDVDKDSKLFKPIPFFLCKTSWDFCKKTDSDDIIKQWKRK